MHNPEEVYMRPEASYSTGRLTELLDLQKAISEGLARDLAKALKKVEEEQNIRKMWQGVASNERNRANGAEGANRVLIERLHGFEVLAATSQGVA